MGLTKPIEQLLIKLLRYIYVSKRYYTRGGIEMKIILLFVFILIINLSLSLLNRRAEHAN